MWMIKVIVSRELVYEAQVTLVLNKIFNHRYCDVSSQKIDV